MTNPQTPKKPTSPYGIGRFGICIDWETTGSDFNGSSHATYQGISFGAIIFDTNTLEEVESVYCELKFDASKYKWSKEAEAIHGLSQEYLAENGMERDEALAELLNLIVKYMGPDPGKIVFMGHNCKFDIDFTKQLANDFGMDITPFHVILDTSSTGFIACGIYKSNDLFEIFTGETRGKHNALDDARQCLATAKGIREIFQIGLDTIQAP